ncbi:SPOR domain-containing protein, partial [Rhizobium hidalgonense]
EAKQKAEQEKKRKDELAEKQEKLDKQAAAKAKAKPDSDEVAANKKLEEERGRAILEGDNKAWMVQVAIASNQANADAVVAKLRAKGYKVKTSQTTKGVRVMVGPEKGRSAADA